MRARREVILSALCALLVACSAVQSASPDAHDPTLTGVGLLPGPSSDSGVPVSGSDPVTTGSPSSTSSSTTTTPPVPTIGSSVTGNRLLMIGDSITASAAQRYGGELCSALVPLGWQVEVDAEPSRFIDFGNTVLDQRLSAKWDAAYVFLGTNYLGDQQSYRKQLEKIVQRLAPAPVVLLTITEFADNRREVNDAITLVATEFSNVRMLDWGAIAAADAATILRGDGHHLTNSGRATLASTVASVMGQAPASTGDCLPTKFTNDRGGSVNGSDTPPPKPVGGTPTTVKSPPPVGGGTPTTKPPATGTSPPPTPAPTTVPTPPTQPPVITVPSPTVTVPQHRGPPPTTTAPPGT
jgi:hypothetical protein